MLSQDLAEKVPAGILQIDGEGTIQWANARHLDLLGVSREEYVGRHLPEFFESSLEGAKLLSRLAAGETLHNCPANFRAIDGSPRKVLVSSDSDMHDGQLLGARLIVIDASEMRPADEEIHRLNAELEERVRLRTAQIEAANKEMESFSYSVSHDLRAPLRALRGFTEVLIESNLSQLDESGQELLRRTHAASIRMERLIEDLLKLARVSRAELQMEPVNLSALATEILADIAKIDPARKVRVTVAPDCVVVADPRLLRVALDNLLSNAWKFTSRHDDARIEFGRVNDPEPAFFVRDNGAGFDMTFAKKLFGVFQRLHAASEFPGTGVGLATVQRILNRHGGKAWADAAVDQGATFFFSLPGMDAGGRSASVKHENIQPPVANPAGGGLGRRRPSPATGN